MPETEKSTWLPILISAAQAAALLVIAGLAGLAIGFTALAFLGIAPWLELDVSYAGAPLPQAGIAVQLTVTFLMASLMAFLPTARRVMALETTHRDFRLGVADIARAYQACHTADRTGVFKLEAEFDAVRERYAFLRGHPDFAVLQSEILEIAAGMSAETRDLARAYADETVERAKLFLQQRHDQAKATERRLTAARATCSEIRHWLTQVEQDERLVRSELGSLERELLDLLPRLGFDTEIEERPRRKAAAKGGKVVPMTRDGKAG